MTSLPATGPHATPVASTDGVTVVAHDHGGSGPALVFCHATGFHGRYWDPICALLGDTYRCIALDLRGHGDSVIPDGLDLAWTGMANDVLAVIDHFELDAVHAVGHSMGGCSIILAELIRPGTIIDGWLFEPIVVPGDHEHYPPDGRNALAESARRRRETFESREAAFQRYSSKPPFQHVDPVALRAYVDGGFRDQVDGTVILKCRGEIEAQVFEHSRTDAYDRLSDVHAPLTIAGSGDADFPATMAPAIAERLPNATFEYFGDLTHFAPLEDPARIAGAIRSSLGH